MKILTHKEYGGKYEFNPDTKKLTKVLELHHSDGSTAYDRFEYHYCPMKYEELEQ